MKFYDLAIKPSKAKVTAGSEALKPWYPSFDVTIEQVPELADFEAGEIVDFHVRTFIARKIEIAVAPGAKKKPDRVELEMRKVAIINIKQIRKDAEEMNLSVEDVKDIEAGRKKSA